MSDSTTCEFECFNFEGMSDTPSELREVVDRSREDISISNNLPSTSSVFSPDVLGSMEMSAKPRHDEPRIGRCTWWMKMMPSPWIIRWRCRPHEGPYYHNTYFT